MCVSDSLMHLSMSTPSPPRTGLGGRYRGFEIVLIQTARPWGRFDYQSARTVRVGEWRRGYTKAYVYNYKSYYIYKFTPYPQDLGLHNKSTKRFAKDYSTVQHCEAGRDVATEMHVYIYECSSYIEHSSLVHVQAFLTQSLFWLFL